MRGPNIAWGREVCARLAARVSYDASLGDGAAHSPQAVALRTALEQTGRAWRAVLDALELTGYAVGDTVVGPLATRVLTTMDVAWDVVSLGLPQAPRSLHLPALITLNADQRADFRASVRACRAANGWLAAQRSGSAAEAALITRAARMVRAAGKAWASPTLKITKGVS